MAEVVWTDAALNDLDAIAEYVAIENPVAAAKLVKRVFRHIDQLSRHPRSGVRIAEIKGARYRQIVEPPCRVFYRFDADTVFILHVMRSERLLRPGLLEERDKNQR